MYILYSKSLGKKTNKQTNKWKQCTTVIHNNENGKKSNRVRLAKQKLCTLFCTFLSRRCGTTT